MSGNKNSHMYEKDVPVPELTNGAPKHNMQLSSEASNKQHIMSTQDLGYSLMDRLQF